ESLRSCHVRQVNRRAAEGGSGECSRSSVAHLRAAVLLKVGNGVNRLSRYRAIRLQQEPSLQAIQLTGRIFRGIGCGRGRIFEDRKPPVAGKRCARLRTAGSAAPTRRKSYCGGQQQKRQTPRVPLAKPRRGRFTIRTVKDSIFSPSLFSQSLHDVPRPGKCDCLGSPESAPETRYGW